MVEQTANDGTGNANPGHKAIAHAAPREQAKSVESQQWTIGVGRHDIDGVDDIGGIDGAKKEDGGEESERHEDVYNFARAFLSGFFPIVALHTDKVDAATRSQGCNG